MKKITNKQKILIAIIALIIIVGAVITATIGLNFDFRLQESKKIELYIETEFEIKDIKDITNEVFGNEPVMIQKVEVYEDSVSITTKEITDEQKQNLINKVNEKYGLEISGDTTEIVSVPNLRGRDMIKPYIVPFAVATVIILIYMAVRYRKLGVIKTILKVIAISIVAQATLLAVIAMTRIPVGRLTIPMVITVYLLTLIGLTTKFEKQLEGKKAEENK